MNVTMSWVTAEGIKKDGIWGVKEWLNVERKGQNVNARVAAKARTEH